MMQKKNIVGIVAFVVLIPIGFLVLPKSELDECIQSGIRAYKSMSVWERVERYGGDATQNPSRSFWDFSEDKVNPQIEHKIRLNCMRLMKR